MLFLAYLCGERYLIDRRIRSIPLRICVTGTRGKSSVTRLVASGLREGGWRVLAKTTGSRPVIQFPDGLEEEVKRRGLPSVLEQKTILRLGESLNIDVLVSEMMSIRPEAGHVESVQILKPQILVVTNVRLDHLAEMGSSKEQIARSFAASIPEGGTVFVPQDEFLPVYRRVAEKMRAEVIPVSEDFLQGTSPRAQENFSLDWAENRRLAVAVADFLKLDRNVSLQGIKKAQPDFGSFKVWRIEWGAPPRHHQCMNCFAVNDPESTRRVLSELGRKEKFKEKKWIGLLSLRKDRGDRTLQWLEALKEKRFPEFRKIYLVGLHARAFKRRLGDSGSISCDVLRRSQPEKLISQIFQREQEECVLVGLGNVGGIGRQLLEYWEKVGRPHDL